MKFFIFIYGKLSPDIPIKYGILYLPYENGSSNFPTWNLKPSIYNIWNLAPQFLCEIWNALHITYSSLCSSFPKYITEKHVYHIQKPRCQHLTWNLEFCISDNKYLCTNVTTYNVKFCKFHIWKSGWQFYSIKYWTIYILHMKILMLILFCDTLNYFFSLMNIWMLINWYEMWNSLCLIYENQDGDFLTLNM